MRLFIVLKQQLHYVMKVNGFIDFTGTHIGPVYFTLSVFNAVGSKCRYNTPVEKTTLYLYTIK
jgi:hypothetical protein